MKRRILFLVVGLLSLVSLLSSMLIQPGVAHALPSNGIDPGSIGMGIILSGNGSTALSSYAVSGVTGVGTKLAFSYEKSGGGLSADGFYNLTGLKGGGYGGNCQGPNSSATQKRNEVALTITLGGKSVVNGSPVVSLCNDEVGYLYYFGETVTAPTAVKPTASIHGTMTYVDENGKTQPFGTSTTGTLVDNTTNATWPISVDANGNLVGPPNISKLTVGDSYTLSGSFLPSDPDGPHTVTYTKTFTLTSGENLDVSQTTPYTAIGGGGGGGGSTTPDCEADGDPTSWILCPIFNAVSSFSDWLFTEVVQPELETTPISTSTTDPSYKIWSNFRVYGDIFLVIALLVVVFGQSIGGGLIDAYTAKKVLPRLLIAAILINLSIYIVAAMVDITNIIGGGVGQIMTGPLAGAGAFQFKINGLQGASILGFSGLGLITAALLGLLALLKAGAAAKILAYVGLFLVMPVVFGLLAAFVTLVIRKAIILALILVSPVAFALYCLPNTEKYFKKWWDFLIQTLIVYPLVIVFFSVADILSVTVMDANHVKGLNVGADSSSVLAAIVAFFLQFLPLLFIPYAFRLAGGAVGKVHEVLTTNHKKAQEGIKGNPNDPRSLRNRIKRNLAGEVTRQQARVVAQGRKPRASNFRRIRGGIADQFGDVDARMAIQNAEARDLSEKMSTSGKDDLRYAGAGYSVAAGEAAPDGTTQSAAWGGALDVDKRRFYDSKGRRISGLQYARGKQLYGTGNSEVAANLEYALRKATTDEDMQNFRTAFRRNAIDNNWNDDEVKNAWATATYPHKDKWKSEWYSTPSAITGANGRTSGVEFADVEDNLDSYDKMINEFHKVPAGFQVSSIRSQDWKAMANTHKTMQDKITAGTATQEDLDRFAKTDEVLDIMTSDRAMGMQRDPSDGDNVMVQGANAETQNVISAMYKSRQYSSTPLRNAADGTYSSTERAVYDRRAVESDRAATPGLSTDDAVLRHIRGIAKVTNERVH
jgi:hypothetical protein